MISATRWLLIPALAGAIGATAAGTMAAPAADSTAAKATHSASAKAAGSASAAGSQAGVLAPLARRTSDEVIARDLSRIEALRTKLDSLPGTPDPWRVAAARLWLEAAREEYLDNDETGFEQAAYAAAVGLVRALESGTAPVTRENVPAALLLAGSVRLRGELWDRLEALKRDEGFPCAAAELAALEVELQWAGHESVDRGDCATGPHLQAAEHHALAAQALASGCRKPEAKPVAQAPPPVALPMPTAEEIRVPKDVHFAVARYDLGPTSRQVIAGVAKVLLKYPAVYVHLTGHTDSRGSEAYNLLLSQRRVHAVYAALRELGVDSVRITIEFVGKAKLYAAEVSTRAYALNRRVEMEFQDADGREIKAERTEADLQVETERPAPPPPPPAPARRRLSPPAKPKAKAAATASKPAAGLTESPPYLGTTPKPGTAKGTSGTAVAKPAPGTTGTKGSATPGAPSSAAKAPRTAPKPHTADSTARPPR